MASTSILGEHITHTRNMHQLPIAVEQWQLSAQHVRDAPHLVSVSQRDVRSIECQSEALTPCASADFPATCLHVLRQLS